MKVYIVGVSGKLGQYLAQHLLDRGYELRLVVKAFQRSPITIATTATASAPAYHDVTA
jgi:nucleoside-diphosphate-sugar epimerase